MAVFTKYDGDLETAFERGWLADADGLSPVQEWKHMISNLEFDMSQLFAPDPTTRWEAARAFAPVRAARVLNLVKHGNVRALSEDVDLRSDLPALLRPRVADWGEHFALFGALNAWMVFVGPSPEGSPPANAWDKFIAITPWHRSPTLGWPHPT